jgi:hypothetical protein
METVSTKELKSRRYLPLLVLEAIDVEDFRHVVEFLAQAEIAHWQVLPTLFFTYSSCYGCQGLHQAH